MIFAELLKLAPFKYWKMKTLESILTKKETLIKLKEYEMVREYTYKKKRESGDGCIRFYTATSERELIDVIRYR